jgi:hypothetical protein
VPLDGRLTLFLCRWPAGEEIPVAFSAPASAAQRDALAWALLAWERAGLGVRFAARDAAAPGGIRVRVRDDWITSQADTVAECAIGRAPAAADREVPGARVVRASIHVAQGDPHLRLTLLHELGHALGFQGHAPGGRTVMLARESEVLARARRVEAGAPLDDAALRALYALPSGAIVAARELPPGRTALADRLAALARERGLAGPWLRAGDHSGLLGFSDAAGRRFAVRIEGSRRALADPAALRLAPASRAAEALLAPAGGYTGARTGEDRMTTLPLAPAAPRRGRR